MTAGRAGQGRAAPPAASDGGEALALPHPDWLYHHLVVTGDADLVTVFRHAAAGPGAIPWADDLAPAEEDWFHLLAVAPEGRQRAISLQGARILAGQLREAVERRRERARARAGRGGAGACPGGCPLDLHRLVPVPAEVLRLGPAHPRARRWLWEHWGTTWALRQVAELPAPKPGKPMVREPGRLRLGFWSADWTPWPALARLRRDWPALRFDVRPRYDDAG